MLGAASVTLNWQSGHRRRSRYGAAMGTIVVGVDGSEGGARALAWASRESQVRRWRLTALMAWTLFEQHRPDDGQSFDPHYGDVDAMAALDTFVVRAVGADAAAGVERRVVCSLAAPALIEAATGASLLVVGARGLGGFRGLLLGSVSQHCLRHAPCPVAVVPQGDSTATPGPDGERIVVGVDGSDSSRRALWWALDEARARRAALDVVHAWHMPYAGGLPFAAAPGLDPSLFEGVAREVLDAAIDAEDTNGLAASMRRILACGGPASSILNAAQGATLVVVGSRGLGGFKGLLLGSVSNQVAHHTPCPVVVVPHDG